MFSTKQNTFLDRVNARSQDANPRQSGSQNTQTDSPVLPWGEASEKIVPMDYDGSDAVKCAKSYVLPDPQAILRLPTIQPRSPDRSSKTPVKTDSPPTCPEPKVQTVDVPVSEAQVGSKTPVKTASPPTYTEPRVQRVDVPVSEAHECRPVGPKTPVKTASPPTYPEPKVQSVDIPVVDLAKVKSHSYLQHGEGASPQDAESSDSVGVCPSGEQGAVETVPGQSRALSNAFLSGKQGAVETEPCDSTTPVTPIDSVPDFISRIKHRQHLRSKTKECLRWYGYSGVAGCAQWGC